MMWNHRLLHYSHVREKINAVVQYDVCCILANEWKEIFNCKSKLLSLLLLPFSVLLAARRKKQINKLV